MIHGLESEDDVATTWHSTLSLGRLDNRRVIIKKSRRAADPRFLAKWHNEVAMLKRIRTENSHLAAMIDSDDSTNIIILRFEPGTSLDQCFLPSGLCSLSEKDASILLRQMSDALCYLHAQQIVHDDVKPDNIMWSAGHAVLVDFGAAYDSAELGRDFFNPSGTPPYASPEFLDRRKGPASDMWALGVTMLFASGKIPLPDGEWILPHAVEEDGAARKEMRAWLSHVQNVRRELPPGDLVWRLLDPDPTSRASASKAVTVCQ